MNSLIERIGQFGVVPVVKIEDAKDALPLAKALVEGGLPCAEITFRTSAAAASIEAICKVFPEMLVGAGTVLTKDQADTAVKCGAKFIVSPGFNPENVRYCIDKGYPVLAGVCTPSEVETAMSYGFSVCKFFPAEQAGGVKFIKALAAVYPSVKFMPTGGVNVGNLRDYLECKEVLACGGTWMVPSDLISKGEFNKIRALVSEAAALVKEIRK